MFLSKAEQMLQYTIVKRDNTINSLLWSFYTLSRLPGSGKKPKITEEIKGVVEEQIRRDDKTTAYQLNRLLLYLGCELSLRTILRCRTRLGWTFRYFSHWSWLLTPEIKGVAEEQMRDDKTTAYQLHRLLGCELSLRTTLRCRMSLGRTFG